MRKVKGDDGGCFQSAFDSVNKYGGVIEHPQGGYGHYARKPTWLYVVGVPKDKLPQLKWGKTEAKFPQWAIDKHGLEYCKKAGEVAFKGGGTNSKHRIGTPEPFRDLLISIVKMVDPGVVSTPWVDRPRSTWYDGLLETNHATQSLKGNDMAKKEDTAVAETTATDEKAVPKSIIPEKYRGKYKGAEDWIKTFIDGLTKTVPMKDKVTKETIDGEEITKTVSVAAGKAKLDLDKLFALTDANGIDSKEMQAQRDRKNAPGRIRMTLGNSLRAEAKHRHGLYDLTGNWHDAPADFLGDAPKTKNQDGSKIVVAKPAVAETAPEAETADTE